MRAESVLRTDFIHKRVLQFSQGLDVAYKCNVRGFCNQKSIDLLLIKAQSCN